MKPALYESHMHTPLCKHAAGDPEEYAAVAEQRGLRGIIVTCHGPLPDGVSSDVRMGVNEFERYVDLVERTREAWAGRVDVRLGLESDFLPGYEAWLEKLHGRAELHHVLGSVHPQIRAYRDAYFTGDWFEYQRAYFRHLAEAAETGLFDTLAHPDLVKNCAPDQWHLDRILPDILRALDRIAATGVAMELNTSGINKAISEMNPGRLLLSHIHERGIPVVLGADAHIPRRVADRFPEALRSLAEIGFEEVSFFLNRKRQRLSVAAALASLSSPVLEAAELLG